MELPRSAVLKYLRQRIKELEDELEDKRVRLFESEEARAELEARVEEKGMVLTPESSSSHSVAQDEESSDEEEEIIVEEQTGGDNEGEHRMSFPRTVKPRALIVNDRFVDKPLMSNITMA